MELVVAQLELVNPLNKAPFYVLIETSGSDEEHDRKVCERLPRIILKSDLIETGCVFGINIQGRYCDRWYYC